jgi:uncharacterized protein involved in outer membrane biogenesis
MAKVLKWVAGLLAALLVLVVVVAILLQQWLRTDDFRARVEKEASAALGVPLKLGRLSIDLWPLPAVAADDVQLQTRPALTIGRVEARPSYAPLLRGRLEIATLIVRKAVLPQTGIAAMAAALQKKAAKGPKPAPAHAAASSRNTMDMLPRRAVFDDITWIDEKGQRITADAEVELGGDGLLDEAHFKIVQGRLAGTQGKVQREGEFWPVRIDIGGGRIAGKLKLQPGKGGAQVLSGNLATDNVEVSALTAPSKPLTGKLQAQTTLRSEFREPGQLVDVLTTQTSFTVRDALISGIDLQKAVTSVGLSSGGITRLDTLSGQVATHGKAVNLTNLVASSGALSATGDVAITPTQALSGRVNVDMARTKGTVGVPLEVGGTVDKPTVMLTRGAMIGAAVGTLIAPGPGTAGGAAAGNRLGDSLRDLFKK